MEPPDLPEYTALATVSCGKPELELKCAVAGRAYEQHRQFESLERGKGTHGRALALACRNLAGG